jgi:hypothetical protein
MMMQHVSAILVVVGVVVAAPSIAAQTNASKASAVGTWTLDVQHSDLGTAPAPKSMTLTFSRTRPSITRGAWIPRTTRDSRLRTRGAVPRMAACNRLRALMAQNSAKRV